jgi:hypothetical protein
VAGSYLLDKGPFPKRAPVLAVGGKLLFDLAVAVQQWADWAIGVVQAWPDGPSQAPTDWGHSKSWRSIFQPDGGLRG